MNISVPQPILNIHTTLETAGYDVYLVGGSVRNMLLDKAVKDWDMTTNATPEQMLQLFPDAFYDNQFGTVGIPFSFPLPGGEDQGEGENLTEATKPKDSEQVGMTKGVVEITTFRSESEYKDKRHPESVTWGKTIEEDLQRRDFTINAMAMQLAENPPPATADPSQEGIEFYPLHWRGGRQAGVGNNAEATVEAHLIDIYNGQEDLKKKRIRAVGNPNGRFKEDALRLMRAARFATQLGFTIEEKTWEAMQTDAALLPAIAGERIKDELLKILASEHPYEGIILLKNAHLLPYILPELLEGIGVSQERPGRHHTTDVFTHNVMSLKECPSTDPIVRFATLIHDIGKPRVRSEDQNGYVIFYNHEVTGARMAYEICNRLRLSKKERDKIVKLIRWHMFTVDEHITDAAVRRFIRRIGVENVKDMMDLRIGDRLGGGTQTAESWRLKLFKQRIEEQLQPEPFSIKDLAIDGNDVMQELNLKPSKKIGEILQKLFEEVDEDLHLNKREHLLKRIKTLT